MNAIDILRNNYVCNDVAGIINEYLISPQSYDMKEHIYKELCYIIINKYVDFQYESRESYVHKCVLIAAYGMSQYEEKLFYCTVKKYYENNSEKFRHK